MAFNVFPKRSLLSHSAKQAFILKHITHLIPFGCLLVKDLCLSALSTFQMQVFCFGRCVLLTPLSSIVLCQAYSR